MDIKTLNLDPDPEFWSNLVPDPGYCYQFWEEEKIIENNFREEQFSS